jgi:hypothetical protein
MWEGPELHWPNLRPEPWTPTRPGAAITACLRSPDDAVVVIQWGSVEEAMAAAEALYDVPCRLNCSGDHVLIWTDTVSVHTVRIGPPPKPLPLAVELAECYPSRFSHLTPSTDPALWPTPSILNRPLQASRGAPMTADELRRAQDEAIAQVGDRQLVPEPGGLAGRVARAHDEAGRHWPRVILMAQSGAKSLLLHANSYYADK